MQDNYVVLGVFKFGKRIYEILNNNGEIKYFEKINEQYVMPILNFNLYDNSGKSLSQVNQHYFMSELVLKIREAYRRKIFVVDLECIKFLDDFISKVCNDLEFKKLLKGSYMNEINEENFENNKKRIVKYLNSFKFDTFIDYNNVAIFNGSLNKNDISSENVNNEEEVSNDLDNFDIDIIDCVDTEFNNEFIDNKMDVKEEKIIDDTIDDVVIDNSIDTMEDHLFDSEVSDDINLDESLYNNEKLENITYVEENISENINNDENNDIELDNQMSNIFFEDELSSNDFDNTSTDILVNNVNSNENIIFGGNDNISFGDNFSYLNEVKSRIENNKSNVGALSINKKNNSQNMDNNINENMDNSMEVGSKKSSKNKLFGRFFTF